MKTSKFMVSEDLVGSWTLRRKMEKKGDDAKCGSPRSFCYTTY